MRKTLLFVFFLLSTTSVIAQTSVDTLQYKRGIFTSKVNSGKFQQRNNQLNKLYAKAGAKESQRLLKQSKIMLPTGAAITLGGLGVATHALIGTRKVANIDGKEYVYYKRPIFHVLGGLALITAGVSIIEFGNDAKIKSVTLYNKKIAGQKVSWTIGETQSGNWGLSLKL